MSGIRPNQSLTEQLHESLSEHFDRLFSAFLEEDIQGGSFKIRSSPKTLKILLKIQHYFAWLRCFGKGSDLKLVIYDARPW
jgi:hypothetical protein